MFRAIIILMVILVLLVNKVLAADVDTLKLDVVSEGYHLDAVVLKKIFIN